MLETQDLRNFSISTWYKEFKSICLQTILVEVPQEILEFYDKKNAPLKEEEDDEEDVENEEDQAEEEVDVSTISPQFSDNLRNALRTFNDQAFVKSNWHAPLDAKMFSLGYTLKVNSLDDIFLFCGVSNILQEDLANKSLPPCLALRKWLNIHPASEFRCIVINNILRGITPRDWPTFYEHFLTDGVKIVNSLKTFFLNKIKGKFPRQHYCFDVILSVPDPPLLLDFGVLNAKTNLYAFSWGEISAIIDKDNCEEVEPVFRCLETDIGIMSKDDALRKFNS